MEAELDLFWFDLDVDAARLQRWRAWLSPHERERAARYLRPEHGHRYLASHAQLRWLLAQRLGCAPAEIVFERGEHGKPRVAGTPLCFNLSHSGGFGLVGLHPRQELGVDIENERTRRDWLPLARRFFAPEETVWLEAQPPAALPRAFCRLWTCKEAWMKADGRGLAAGPRTPRVTLAPGAAQLAVAGTPWFVRELETASGYAAAVVMAHPPAAVRLERLAPPAD
jgi:4'-phosphopantetheinyl transferase